DGPQRRHPVLHLASRGGRRVAVPTGVDQAREVDRAVRAQQERAEDPPLTRPADVDLPTVRDCAQWTQDPELHGPSPAGREPYVPSVRANHVAMSSNRPGARRGCPVVGSATRIRWSAPGNTTMSCRVCPDLANAAS